MSDSAAPGGADQTHNSDTAASPSRQTTDEQALLSLMQSEMTKSKLTERSAQEALEQKERDVVRTTTMLKLAQERIDRLKDDNRDLEKQLASTREELDTKRSKQAELEKHIQFLEDDLKYRQLKSIEIESDASSKVAKLTLEKENLNGSLERLRAELEERKQQLVQLQKKLETDNRSAFETKVALETKLKAKEEELWFLEDLRKKETNTTTSREYDLSKKITALQHELTKHQNEGEATRRSMFETTASLTTENEQLKLKLAQLEGMTKVSDRENFEKIQRLTLELTMLRERSEQDQLAFKAREKALEGQIAKFVTDLRVAQAEVNSLSTKEVDSTKGHVDTIVQLSAARDTLRERVRIQEEELAEVKKALREKQVELSQYKDDVNRRTAQTTLKYDAQLSSRSDEIAKLTYELTQTATKLISVQEELDNLKRQKDIEGKSHAAEVGSLKAEVEGYRKSVEQLEKHIKENYALKALEEQNNSLKAQNTQLKNQIATTNSALANLRVEADISETYRLKLMQEEVETQLARVSALEKERRFARPLIQDLVEVVQREQLTDAALARDIDMFFRQFGSAIRPTSP